MYRKNSNDSKKDNSIGNYLLPALITATIVFAIFIAKGIWPFGANRIDYYDNMQQVAPLFTHLWDYLHGDASLFFDWTTGLGANVSMSVSAFSMLSPFNLLLYFVPRAYILESISILTLIKMACMSLTMYIFLNKKFETPYALKVFFSVAYSMCGYSILYASCFTPWMEILVFLPLLILAYDRMMTKGKKLAYIIMVAICYIANYYLATMCMLYIFLISGTYILFLVPNKERKNKAWNLGIGTLAGIGLSAFALIPVFDQLKTSQRGTAGGSLLNQYKNIINATIPTGAMSMFQKWMMIYGTAFAIAVIIIGVRKCKEESDKNKFALSAIFFVTSPLILESIDLVWHFGSYNGYSARFGFLIGFTLISAGCYYSGKLFSRGMAPNKFKATVIAVTGIVLCAICALLYNVIPINGAYGALAFFGVIFVVAVIANLWLYAKKRHSLNYGTFILIASVEVFIGAYALIGAPKFYPYEPYQYGDYVQDANEVKEAFTIAESATDRIKNPDISLNANYPLILKRSALSSFTAALQSDTQTNARKWGYSKYFLWLLDSGGTVFSDALLHVTEAVNSNPLDSALYTVEKTSGDYSLYSSKYTLPFGMTVSSDLAELDLSKCNWITLHNEVYTALSGDKEPLVTGMKMTKIITKEGLDCKLTVTGNGAVYINIGDIYNKTGDANSSWLCDSIQVYVNDEVVLVPTFGALDNTKYPDDYNNNLLYLGTFEDETVDVRIVYDDPWCIKISEMTIAQIDMDKVEALCDKYKEYDANEVATNNSLTFSVIGDKKNDMTIIPVVYNTCWNITVNDKEVSAQQVAGLFTGIPLENGQNVIKMTFVPAGLKAGTIISVITAILIMFGLMITYTTKFKIPSFLGNAADLVFAIGWAGLIVLMFVVPIVYGVAVRIMKIMMMLIGLIF